MVIDHIMDTCSAKGSFPYTRQRCAAGAAATHLNIYGSNPERIIPYIVMYVAAAAAAHHCHEYGNAPLAY